METHHLPEDDRDTKLSWIHDHPQLAALFSRNGDVVPVGTTIKRPEYAHTLESIAHGGAAAFYEGQLAHSIVDAVHEAGGMLSLEDLRCSSSAFRTLSQGMKLTPLRLQLFSVAGESRCLFNFRAARSFLRQLLLQAPCFCQRSRRCHMFLTGQQKLGQRVRLISSPKA